MAAIYAHDYPSEAAGLVLVDPAYRETELRAALTDAEWIAREAALARYVSPMSEGQTREKSSLNTSGQQAFDALPLPRVPVVLLSATKINASFPSSHVEREVKLKDHRGWAARVGAVDHLVVDSARHYIQNEAPAEVIAAIENVLNRVPR